MKDNGENGTLQLHVTTCGVPDLYDQVTEIDDSISIKWMRQEVNKVTGGLAGTKQKFRHLTQTEMK